MRASVAFAVAVGMLAAIGCDIDTRTPAEIQADRYQQEQDRKKAEEEAAIKRRIAAYDAQRVQEEADHRTQLQDIAAHGTSSTERRKARHELKVIEEAEKAESANAAAVSVYTARMKECCDAPAFLQPRDKKLQCARWGFAKCVGLAE
jgi:hypothetical protein